MADENNTNTSTENPLIQQMQDEGLISGESKQEKNQNDIIRELNQKNTENSKVIKEETADKIEEAAQKAIEVTSEDVERESTKLVDSALDGIEYIDKTYKAKVFGDVRSGVKQSLLDGNLEDYTSIMSKKINAEATEYSKVYGSNLEKMLESKEVKKMGKQLRKNAEKEGQEITEEILQQQLKEKVLDKYGTQIARQTRKELGVVPRGVEGLLEGKTGKVLAGVGVAAFVISNMNKRRGEQSNSELYGQQQPYR